MKELITIIALILVSPASFMLGVKVQNIKCDIKIKKAEKKNREEIIKLEKAVQLNDVAKLNKRKEEITKEMDIRDEYDEGYLSGLEYAINILSK